MKITNTHTMSSIHDVSAHKTYALRTNFATCFKVTRRDGLTIGFTDSDDTIVIDEIVYHAQSGMRRSAMEASHDVTVDNLEIEGMLSHHLISHEDIMSGKYDHATISIFLADLDNIRGPKTQLRTGWIGSIRTLGSTFVAHIHGMLEAFNQTIGQVYSPMCRATLGDSQCGVNLDLYAHKGTVKRFKGGQLVSDGISPPPKANGDFLGGIIKFTSGKTLGNSYEIYRHYGKTIIIEPDIPVNVGDTFMLFPGCDKGLGTCIGKFCNAINFRGEPFVPDLQKI
jgi:uncharacterized phage protein (TIGR02218 family)